MATGTEVPVVVGLTATVRIVAKAKSVFYVRSSCGRFPSNNNPGQLGSRNEYAPIRRNDSYEIRVGIQLVMSTKEQ